MKNNLRLKQATGLFRSILLLLLIISVMSVNGQDRNISGTVTDQSNNESLPGASVVIKGTSKGATTDMEGQFNLTLAPNENTLVVSYIGYETVEVAIGTQKILKVALAPSRTSLEEVVVVGYGSTKVKDLTSSITTLRTEDLIKTPASQPLQALQGKVAGLQVVTNGGPGDVPTIRVRGIGSFPGRAEVSEAPLYVVDGMFFDNIDFLNPSDIASISVMKDASAAAIYGVRAANGVVLIETRSGQYNQKNEIIYNGYFGYQIAQDVVKMANSEQFTQMAIESGSAADESFILNAMQRYGRSRTKPNIPEPNTDWYAEILRPAMISNNSLDFSGGTEKARYSIGTSYFNQDGIMDMKNSYERLNLRSKVDLKATNWLTIGGNMIFSNATKFNDAEGAWNQAYFAVPVMPVYDELNVDAFPIRFSNAQAIGYRSGQNPFPAMNFNIDRMKIKKLLANFYMEATILPKILTFKTSYNYSSTSVDQRIVNLPWFLVGGGDFKVTDASLTRNFSDYNNHIWDNVLTLTQKYGNHNFTLMGGTSFKDENYLRITAVGKNFPTNMEQSWYLNLAEIIDAVATTDDGLRQYGMSYFGRFAYNYMDRYLLYATMRRDGSNKYQQTWGNFPTIGVGWVITEEGFFKDNGVVDYLKFRASWGQLGNDRVPASDGAFTTTPVNTSMGGAQVAGTVVSNSYSELKWELTEETNVGFTSRMVNNKLSAEFDYYTRDTKNAAIPVIIPGTGITVLRPRGTIRNSGVELALTWTNKISDRFSYSVGGNFSTLRNEATDLYGLPYIDGGSAEFRQRTYVGEPLMAFYGWEIAGVYQTQSEVETDPTAITEAEAGNILEPGDFKYVDQNSDGKIDGDDRVILGSFFPKIMYGGDINIKYMSFDFSASIYGQAGNKILNRKRGELIWTPDGNLDADLAVNRWHGPGTSNEYPSSKGLRKGWNQKMSDYFIEDGAFIRIQNVQLGYTFFKVLGVRFPETRIALTAERPLNFFNYNGFTPEVPNGIDTQTYPIPAVYTVNLNVKF